MLTFKKYYNLLLLPAIAVILFSLLSGFTKTDEADIIEEMLRERTRILQDCYYGLTDIAQAEDALAEFETYPLLSEDIKSLREWEDTEVDIVEKMSFISMEKKHSIFGSDMYETEICWEVSGLGEDYTLRGNYHIVVKKENNQLFLSTFAPLE